MWSVRVLRQSRLARQVEEGLLPLLGEPGGRHGCGQKVVRRVRVSCAITSMVFELSRDNAVKDETREGGVVVRVNMGVEKLQNKAGGYTH